MFALVRLIRNVASLGLIALFSSVSLAQTTVIFADNFESGTSQWNFTSTQLAGVSSQTFQSRTRSLFLRNRTVTVTSDVINANVRASGATFTVWIRRGADAFSEDPDRGEDLIVSYLNSSNSWVTLETFLGSGTKGQIYRRSYALPVAALHSGLRLRFHLTRGSGTRYDYWHVDDVRITANIVSLNHFKINHDNTAVYCANETITVSARDSGSAVVTNYTGTMTLDTQAGKGDWSLSSGSGTFNNGAANDGVATYTFSSADNGVASFTLSYLEGANSINVDVYDSNNIRDDDSEGNLNYSATGFTITASALPNPPPSTINDPIGTQVSGQAFAVHIAAYGINPANSQCGIIETYTGNKPISISTHYSDPTSGTLVALGSGTLNFTNGQAVVTTQYNDVGRIYLGVADTSSTVAGQSNTFVVKPAGFTVAIPNNPKTTNAGSGFIAAGDSFTVNVQAVNAQGNVTPNYGREQVPESVAASITTLVFPSGGNVGSLANATTFTKVGNGIFQNTQLSWNEVGSLQLAIAVADGNYLGAGNVSSGPSDTVGRFYPDGFFLHNQSVAHACGSFSYLSEPSVVIAYTLDAVSSHATVTSNYDSGLGYPVGSPQHHGEYSNNGVDLGARLSINSAQWSAGRYRVTDNAAMLSRDNTRERPLLNVALGLSLSDIDNRTLTLMDMNPTTTGNCTSDTSCTAAVLGTASFYYGRLRLPDSFGPETAELPAKLHTDYWDGQQFTLHLGDSCTQIPRNRIRFNNTAIVNTSDLSVNLSGGTTSAQFDQLTTSEVGFIGGDAGLRFSSPGTGISVKSFTVDIDLALMPWLRYDWDQDGNDNNDTALPTATMSFKTYRGHDRILYWRQVF